MSDKERFKIGDCVAFSLSYMTYDSKGARVLVTSKSRLLKGIIAGACYRHEGVNHPGGNSFDGEMTEYEDPWFESTKRHFLYKIKEGMMNKEHLALPKDIKLIEPFKIPILKTHQPEYTEAWRKMMSEDSKNWPRDSKGRWAKLGEPNV